MHLQRIDGPARVHLDLDSVDPGAARALSTSLGACAQWERPEALAMTSPGGLWFCHSHDDGRRLVRSDPERVLDQVCIDVPASRWQEETEFWESVTGRTRVDAGSPEFDLLDQPGRARILLQRLGERTGPVRAHLDFATADRDAETHRHQSLGADLLETCPRWTVLRSPDGRAYCLTDRDPRTGS